MESGEATTTPAGATSEDRQIPHAPRQLTIQPVRMTATLVITALPMARTRPRRRKRKRRPGVVA